MQFCQQKEHDNARIEYICLYKECQQQRLCCNFCIQSLYHEHDSFYMDYLEVYQVLNNFINLSDKKNSIIINASMIDYIVQQKFVTIKTADQKLKPISHYKSCFNNSSKINTFKIKISNNKKLFVTQDNQLKLKIWGIQNNFKIIKCINFDKEINSIAFSENDKYIFLGLNNQIVKIDVLRNFQITQLLNLNSENSCVYLRIINSILVYYYSTKIIKFDYQLNLEIKVLDIGEQIQSIDIQSMTNNLITLDVQDNITLWSQNGDLILQKRGNEYYMQEINFICFLGDKDIIIIGSKQRITIWNICYKNKTLYIEKIIYCSQMNRISKIWLNTQLFQLFLIRDHDIITYSIFEDKYQSKRINADYYDYASYHVLPKNNQLIIIKEKTWNIRGLIQNFFVIKKRQIEI